MKLHVPTPMVTKRTYVMLRVPSKSSPDRPRKIHFYASGRHHCDCPGHIWAMRMKQYFKKCRHYKMTTMHAPDCPNSLKELEYALQLLGDRNKPTYVSWAFINCQFPEHIPILKLHCRDCPLYPEVCSVHTMRYGKRQRRKPLVWRLQTAIYQGRRKVALKLMRKLVKLVRALKSSTPSEREMI